MDNVSSKSRFPVQNKIMDVSNLEVEHNLSLGANSFDSTIVSKQILLPSSGACTKQLHRHEIRVTIHACLYSDWQCMYRCVRNGHHELKERHRSTYNYATTAVVPSDLDEYSNYWIG